MNFFNYLWVVLFVTSVMGCATPSEKTNNPEPIPRTLGKEIRAFQTTQHPDEQPIQTSGLTNPTGTLNLAEVLSLALMQSPELTVYSWEIRAVDAKKLQANLLPNPEISFEGEQFGGSGAFQGTQNLESTIQLSQLIELGGKRIKRSRIASLESVMARWDYETKRLDVLTEATIAFTNVLAAQEQLALTREIVKLARQVYNTVFERVNAGKISPVDEIKAGVALSKTKIELDRSKGKLNLAREILAGTWGGKSALYGVVEGNINLLLRPPPLEYLKEHLKRNPDIARWATELARQKATVKYAQSTAIPDITISGGIKKTSATNDNSFVAGVSIPLQIFNRNKGNILEAKYRLIKTKEEQRAAEVRSRIFLAQAFQALVTAFSGANAWKDKILPRAQASFDAVNEGYQYGKFGLLDVLDAQKTLFEARRQYINSLAEYHRRVAQVERLTGTSLGDLEIEQMNTSEIKNEK